MIRFGFEELGLARIQATADIRNTASWRVMEKLGMRREAAVPMERPAGDGVLYVVRRDGWRARGPLPER